MSILVREFIDSVKETLQETDTGTFWTDATLVDYLNQAYDWVTGPAPEAFTVNSEFTCVAGTRQDLPTEALRLINVIRNNDGDMAPVHRKTMNQMNTLFRKWHAAAQSNQQQFFIYDDADPMVFWVYPPAKVDSLLQIATVNRPSTRHITGDYTNGTTYMAVNERYNQPLKFYCLFLAYSKGSEDSNNANLASSYLAAAYNALGVKIQNDARVSPNNPANKGRS